MNNTKIIHRKKSYKRIKKSQTICILLLNTTARPVVVATASLRCFTSSDEMPNSSKLRKNTYRSRRVRFLHTVCVNCKAYHTKRIHTHTLITKRNKHIVVVVPLYYWLYVVCVRSEKQEKGHNKTTI